MRGKTHLIVVIFTLITWSAFAQQKPLVLATTSVFADMAQNIAGDDVEVQTIVPIGADLHTYKPSPRDAQSLASADLILKNGLNLEPWLNELIIDSGAKAKVISITDGIQFIEKEPHAWMSAESGLIYIENIKNALIALHPEGQRTFEFNYSVYRQQLLDMDIYIQEQIMDIPEKQRILLTSHDAFRYFGRRYGFRVENLNPNFTEKMNKPLVFIGINSNLDSIQQLIKDHKISIGGKLFFDSIGDKNGVASSYLDMLKYNTDIIVAAITKEFLEKNTVSSSINRRSALLLGIISGILIMIIFYWIFKKVNG